jgi:uncharacterized protein
MAAMGGEATSGAGRGAGRERRFDAFRLSASGESLAGDVDPAALERLADRVSGSGGRVAWSIRGLRDEEGRPALRIAIDGDVPLVCQRCLGPLSLRVEQSTDLLLARDEADLVHLDEASEREVVLANGPLDALALVEDELLLTLPFSPRHEESCAAAQGGAQ